MLANVIKLVSGCVTFLGGFLVVWGAVSLGLAIREQQGGPQIATAISNFQSQRDTAGAHTWRLRGSRSRVARRRLCARATTP